MFALAKRIWHNRLGATISTELILLAAVLAIGMIVGVQSVRDAVVAESDAEQANNP